ncbi:hypothetical protein BGS_1041 [Beggiatoa sp. SS]|nr:hypothetical protein BGS_1041 [Beggiatoa sp. SS]
MLLTQFQKNKIPKTTTLLYAYKYYVTNCLLTQSRRAAENERRLIKGVGILIFWSYLNDFFEKFILRRHWSAKFILRRRD